MLCCVLLLPETAYSACILSSPVYTPFLTCFGSPAEMLRWLSLAEVRKILYQAMYKSHRPESKRTTETKQQNIHPIQPITDTSMKNYSLSKP